LISTQNTHYILLYGSNLVLEIKKNENTYFSN